jgi:hypothetical protein
MSPLRNAAISTALAVTVTALAGVLAPGETRQASVAEICSHMTWPPLPQYCLIGGSTRPVRVIATDRGPADETSARFKAAFE